MSSKFTTARLTLDGERFEILVHPDAALNYRLGRNIEPSQVVAVEEIYSDSSKGLRVAADKLTKHFHTANFLQVAEQILRRGELQLTTEQRRRLVDEKRRQIIATIARNYADPRTGLPHPPVRIEQALQDARVSIDPFRDADEQAKGVVEQLRAILPLRSERVKLAVKVPPQFAPQAIGVLKSYGELQKENWGADGSLTVMIEVPAGVQPAMLERLGSVTKGSGQATVVK
jgi:ribosome maturation protein SDO1